MFSVPPHKAVEAFPIDICSAPEIMVSKPEPQIRCNITAGIPSGMPEYKPM